MSKIKKIYALILVSILLVGTLGACGKASNSNDTNNNNANSQVENPTKAPDNSDTTKNDDKNSSETDNIELSGILNMAGSTSMEKLSNVAAEAFMIKYPKTQVSAEFIGSSAGVEAVLAGTVDIGNASRELKDTEKASGAVENVVAIDGIAVVTDKANTVTDLTKDQLTKIYTGEITNWNELGGADQPIVVIGREAGSGTRGAFEELLKIEDQCKYSNEINSTGGVMAKVASTPGAIGYVSLDIVDNSVNAMNLEGVEPTAENIKAGNYFLSRPFVMATVGQISEQSDLVQAFFSFLQSEEGKELIKGVGLITVD